MTRPEPDIAGRAASVAHDLLRAAADVGFRGSDPYDALGWPHWPRLLVAGSRRRTVIVQLHARAPVDIRRLYRRQHSLIPKTLGVFGSAALRLHGGGRGSAETRRHGTTALELLHADQGAGAGWGYPWDVQTRWSFYPAGVPNVVATVYAARALAEGARRWDRPEWHERACGAAQWVLDELLQPEGHFAYHTASPTLVHNANLLGAQLVHALLGEPEVVRRAVVLTLSEQRPDGSWAYGSGARLGFVDSFHTAYNLECLSLMRHLHPSIPDALAAGARYWRERFFQPDGTATLWPDRRWPEDAHATGTALTTASELVRSGLSGLKWLERITQYALSRMVAGDHAISRRYRFGRTHLTYVRWCDAHMALGLANAAAALAAVQPYRAGVCNSDLDSSSRL